MSDALAFQGSKLQRGNGSTPEVFTDVAEMVGFSGLGGGAAAVIDVTHSLSSGKEKRMGLLDEGQVTVDVNFIPGDAQQAGLHADRRTQVLRNFKLVYSNGDTDAFSAFVLSFEKSGEVDGKIAGSITLEISGAAVPSY